MLKHLLFITLLLCTASAYITIEKEAPESIRLGDVLQVNITVHNQGHGAVNVSIKDTAGTNPIEPEPIQRKWAYGGLPAAEPPFYLWGVTVESWSEKTVYYKEKPSSPGPYHLGKATAYSEQGEVESNSLVVMVLCNQNGLCEENEDYRLCPEDCPSGSSDAYCDQAGDGICDLDCMVTEARDPDCEYPPTEEELDNIYPDVGKVEPPPENEWLWFIVVIGAILLALLFFIALLFIVAVLIFKKLKGGSDETK